jgi:hypothetical protein
LRVLGVGEIGPPDNTGFARRDSNRGVVPRLGILDVFCDVGAQLEKGRLLDQDLVQFLPLRSGGRPVFLQLLDGGKPLDGRVLGLVVLDAGKLVSLVSLCDAADNRPGLLHVGILDAGCEENLVCHDEWQKYNGWKPVAKYLIEVIAQGFGVFEFISAGL